MIVFQMRIFHCTGFNMDPQSDHVSYICKSANYHLYNINMIRKYLSIKSTNRHIEILFKSRLYYGNIILIEAPIYILNELFIDVSNLYLISHIIIYFD